MPRLGVLDPRGGEFKKKLTLTHIPDPNRYQFCTLYIADWWTVVVEGGKCPTPRTKGGGIVREGNVRGRICPGICPAGMSVSQMTSTGHGRSRPAM